MAKHLEQDEIDKKLAQLPVEWTQAGNSLERTYNFSDFNQALEFTNRVGGLANKLNHHPTITLEWGKVITSLTTHDSGGITEADFKLAIKIDQAYGEDKDT